MIKALDTRITKYDLKLIGAGAFNAPIKIAFIADLHIDSNTTPAFFSRMSDLINEQEPEVVLLGGDIITSSYRAMGDSAAYAEVLRGIEAPGGKYAVYGNHDVDEVLIGGFAVKRAGKAKRHPELDGFVRSCGFQLMEDEHITIPGTDIVLVGRRDLKRPGDGVEVRAELGELMAGVDTDRPVILLQHEPEDLNSLEEHGIDLALSGHTHNGQIFPGNIYCSMMNLHSYGIKRFGSATSIVTSGVGYYGLPIRIGTISEVVVVDITWK